MIFELNAKALLERIKSLVKACLYTLADIIEYLFI